MFELILQQIKVKSIKRLMLKCGFFLVEPKDFGVYFLEYYKLQVL